MACASDTPPSSDYLRSHLSASFFDTTTLAPFTGSYSISSSTISNSQPVYPHSRCAGCGHVYPPNPPSDPPIFYSSYHSTAPSDFDLNPIVCFSPFFYHDVF